MAEKKVPMKILRDYWKEAGNEGRVRAGTVVEVTAEDAIDLIEKGSAERVK